MPPERVSPYQEILSHHRRETTLPSQDQPSIAAFAVSSSLRGYNVKTMFSLISKSAYANPHGGQIGYQSHQKNYQGKLQ
jgi:hypothetical protein